ncbi:MAG: hypothetical protein ABSG29_07365 [Steroidobacteraceae bacterium]|jgi:hypothetical protein
MTEIYEVMIRNIIEKANALPKGALMSGIFRDFPDKATMEGFAKISDKPDDRFT